ncbi:hypothetical protein FRB96_001593 [Tulasnella sp. 330]|nr:hypothetical protein FRB96_001593 [Tulasnella sp. 330]KAG8876044.1 hypothetical protein FRB97_004510 [Tulasnella sp. 331]KAG8880944.1 hypothetical protein FRB98_004660 [Tulasnella sp. 332]
MALLQLSLPPRAVASSSSAVQNKAQPQLSTKSISRILAPLQPHCSSSWDNPFQQDVFKSATKSFLSKPDSYIPTPIPERKTYDRSSNRQSPTATTAAGSSSSPGECVHSYQSGCSLCDSMSWSTIPTTLSLTPLPPLEHLIASDIPSPPSTCFTSTNPCSSLGSASIDSPALTPSSTGSSTTAVLEASSGYPSKSDSYNGGRVPKRAKFCRIAPYNKPSNSTMTEPYQTSSARPRKAAASADQSAVGSTSNAPVSKTTRKKFVKYHLRPDGDRHVRKTWDAETNAVIFKAAQDFYSRWRLDPWAKEHGEAVAKLFAEEIYVRCKGLEKEKGFDKTYDGLWLFRGKNIDRLRERSRLLVLLDPSPLSEEERPAAVEAQRKYIAGIAEQAKERFEASQALMADI